ncbi:hypothetical protein ACIPLC_15705 [Kitasatospora sp. NPDC086801]|uniref:hypothetical protein n=1 Tax=unclassified Kitasatospora TaxID=2633591 RepID=UPI003812A268
MPGRVDDGRARARQQACTGGGRASPLLAGVVVRWTGLREAFFGQQQGVVEAGQKAA